ncbi:MAG: hypothetical protein ACXVNM_00785 [Bacteroidia bacterium]
MEKFIFISLIVHITAGCLALLSGLGAIIFRNKVKIHKPFGKIYFWCMTVIFFTAIYISTYKGNVFLFCVAFFTYYSCLTAYRSLKLKNLHREQKPGWFDWAIEGFFGLMHIGFIGFAFVLLNGPNTSFGIISLAFGVLGIRGNYITIKRLRKKIEYRNYWLLAHIGGMCGSYIGALTAFLVNNNRWIHAPNLLIWLGPAVFLVPLILFEIRSHQQKAGKFATA